MCFIENGFCLMVDFFLYFFIFSVLTITSVFTPTLTELEHTELVSTTDMELDSISVKKLASLFPEVDPASTTELVLTILELEQDNTELVSVCSISTTVVLPKDDDSGDILGPITGLGLLLAKSLFNAHL